MSTMSYTLSITTLRGRELEVDVDVQYTYSAPRKSYDYFQPDDPGELSIEALMYYGKRATRDISYFLPLINQELLEEKICDLERDKANDYDEDYADEQRHDRGN